MPNSVRFDQSLPVIERSHSLTARSRRAIPAAALTRADQAGRFVDGLSPKYFARARAARVWDVDGNEYLDLSMTAGPVLLGYGYAPVDDAVRHQLERGSTFSGIHPLEVEMAELVKQLVPAAEMVRFGRAVSDVTGIAARLAMHYTARERVVRAGYAQAAFSPSTSEPSSNVSVRGASCHELSEVIDELDDRVACVILEPAIIDRSGNDFVPELQRVCERHGVLLVLDETFTGFRVALGGAQERHGIRADLVCFSRAMANGLPLSALTGRVELMRLLENENLGLGPLGADSLSLAAAQTTLSELAKLRVPEELQRRGERFEHAFSALARGRKVGKLRLIGQGARTALEFDASVGDAQHQRLLLQLELLRHGVLWSGCHTLSLAHTDAELDHLLGAYDRSLEVLATALGEGDVLRYLLGRHLEPLRQAAR